MRDAADLPAFHAATGVPTALDETLDALLAGGAPVPGSPPGSEAHCRASGANALDGLRGGGCAQASDLRSGLGLDLDASGDWARALDALQAEGAGLAAAVLKPAAVGGFEAAAAVARWAGRAGVKAGAPPAASVAPDLGFRVLTLFANPNPFRFVCARQVM